MAEDLISEYINRDGIRGDTKFMLDNINSVYNAYVNLFDTFKKTEGLKAPREIISELSKATEATKNLRHETDRFIQSKQKDNNISLSAAKIKSEEAKAAKETAGAKQLEARETERSAKAKEKESKLLDQAANDYYQLSKAYNDAALKAKNYYLTLGENHPITVQAVKDASDISNVLKKVDASVGQFQRNVGNYKSAFDGLGFSFTQVARELPSLSISVQQFALAISNNLPMVADELAKARTEIAALKAEGKEAPSLLRRIGGALFSWQVGLSIGITLLTVYSKQLTNFFSKIFGGTKAVSDLARQQSLLNEVQRDVAKSAGDELASLDALYKVATNILLPMKERKAAVDDIQDEYPQYFKNIKDEVILQGKAEDAYKKTKDAILESAKARAIERRISALYDRELNLELDKEQNRKSQEEQDRKIKLAQARQGLRDVNSRQGLSGTAAVNEEKTYRERLINQEKDINKELDNIAKDREFLLAKLTTTGKKGGGAGFLDDYLERERAAALELFRFRKQAEIDLQKSLVEITTGEDRSAARQKQYELEIELIKGVTQFELAEKGLTKNQIKLINEKSEADEKESFRRRIADLVQFSKEEKDIINNQIEDFREAARKAKEEEIKNAIESTTKRAQEGQDARESFYNKLLIDENENYKKRLDSAGTNQKKIEKAEKDHQTRLAEIKLDAAISDAKAQINIQKDILSIIDLPEKEKADALRKLSKLEKELSDLSVEKVEAANKKKKLSNQDYFKDLEEALRTALSYYDQISSIISGAFEAGATARRNEIQEQIELLEKQKKADIDLVNSSVTNRQEAAAQVAIIEARAQAQREQLEQRQKNLDYRRAQFDKAASIARIAIETAQAVVHQLATGDPFTAFARATLVGVLGAAQLAVAVATPIPRYKHGKNKYDNYEGPAIVGDGGKPEAIVREDGSVEITDSKPQLTFVKRNDIILPEVPRLAVKESVPNESDQKIEMAVNRMEKNVVKAIKKIPQPVIKVENVISKWIRSGDSSSHYLNRQQ